MHIVLIPGFMADAALWDDIVPTLQRLGSVAHAEFGGAATIGQMARHVLRAMPGTAVLIGFSMGGYVAREIARIAPDRVKALVLIATSARADTAEHARRKAAAARAVDQRRLCGLSRNAVLRSIHADRRRDAALVDRIRAMSARVGADAFVAQATEPRSGDLDRLDTIRCPTLIVAADGDAIRGLDESRELQRGIAGADLAVIEGSGHMIPMEKPAGLAAILVPWLAAQLVRSS
jgi:pimeloyl-ACP methyl ester carboxylesterase